MNPERILLRLGRLAATLVGSRDSATVKAARRARGSLAMVRSAVRDDVDTHLLVAALLEAMIILQALDTRARTRGDRRRSHALAQVRPAPVRRITDAQIAAALEETGGHVRAAARLLDVAPSTVSRRTNAHRDSPQRLAGLLPTNRRAT